MHFGWPVFLAQMDSNKLDPALPQLSADVSYGMTWIIAAVLFVGILVITFKTSKRNVVVETKDQ